MQLLQLRKLTHATPFERCRLNDPLVGGLTWTQEMGKRLLACTGYEFEGPIAAAMTFYAAGRMYRTDWFRSQIVVREGRIVTLEPSNMPTRRVRQVERKGQRTPPRIRPGRRTAPFQTTRVRKQQTINRHRKSLSHVPQTDK